MRVGKEMSGYNFTDWTGELEGFLRDAGKKNGEKVPPVRALVGRRGGGDAELPDWESLSGRQKKIEHC